ncbi:hypothetical protein ACFQY8_03215 [Alloscardovia venturai]|uniref:YbjN domain-containing protein n=1 Tax=Alloscardovia venturai TaxID=1769421 RepID=A0ABW2Y3C9_9BIFI
MVEIRKVADELRARGIIPQVKGDVIAVYDEQGFVSIELSSERLLILGQSSQEISQHEYEEAERKSNSWNDRYLLPKSYLEEIAYDENGSSHFCAEVDFPIDAVSEKTVAERIYGVLGSFSAYFKWVLDDEKIQKDTEIEATQKSAISTSHAQTRGDTYVDIQKLLDSVGISFICNDDDSLSIPFKDPDVMLKVQLNDDINDTLEIIAVSNRVYQHNQRPILLDWVTLVNRNEYGIRAYIHVSDSTEISVCLDRIITLDFGADVIQEIPNYLQRMMEILDLLEK